MSLLATFKNKQILVLGAGLTGMSCMRFLASQGLCFAVNDSRAEPFSGEYSEPQFHLEFPQANLVLGQWDSELIAKAEVILISPGIDPATAAIAQFINADCQLMGDVELFCQLNNERIKPIDILAVTGSNGKSTVVSLLGYLANSLGINSQVGGNIGQPVLDIFTSLGKQQLPAATAANVPQLLVLELSSFQLETLNSMQAIATTVLNVSDDHLDRHLSMANYQAIKQGIYAQGHIAVINRDDVATVALNAKQKSISFGSDEPKQGQFGVRALAGKAHLAFGQQNLIALEQLPLAGMHNALNYLAVLALGYCAGWSLTAMVENLAGFTGLAHRCQRFNSKDGITWINDSKATNVGATLAAINGLAQTLSAQQNLILIAGGDGKGADFTPLAKPFERYVSHLITLGKDGDKLAKLTTKSTPVSDLKAAVLLAKSKANVGDIVLLSPACASIDMFKNYLQRGEQFIAAVESAQQVSV